MGFFDLANPVLDAINGIIPGGPLVQLSLWAIVSGVLTILLYRLVSPQEKMSELKPQIKAAQKKLAEFDGEPSEILPLMKESIGLSLRQLGMALMPALLASIPIIFVLAWASNRLDVIPPEAGAQVPIAVQPGNLELDWYGLDLQATEEAASWIISWPSEQDSASIQFDGDTVLALPIPRYTEVVHKKIWWNSLIGNQAGYLPEGQPVELIQFDFAHHEYLPFGPDWMRGWLTYYLLLLFVSSLVVKFLFKIH